MQPSEAIGRMRSFLDRIGIVCREGAIEGETFLPGLLIDQGSLTIDLSKLSYPGDILHEAGHIALTDPAKRPFLNQEMLNAQSGKESEEIGVLLWTFLASREIGFPDDFVFHAGGYKGQSTWLMEQYQAGHYIGLPLLVWMGITTPSPAGGLPVVKSWLRI